MARTTLIQSNTSSQAVTNGPPKAYKRKVGSGRTPLDHRYLPYMPPKSQQGPWSAPLRTVTTSSMYLPTEIILHILSFVPASPASQPALYACCLLSRQWYSAAVPILYSRPYFYGKNFDPFAATICPSINAHIRKSDLAEMVRCLDMSHLVHHGSKSLTARLLGRTKAQLEEFIAPQASFAVNCFAALTKCRNLRILDLSLLSEAAELRTLFHTLGALPNLEVFRFPRCLTSFRGFSPKDCKWPPTLRTLYLSGGYPFGLLQNIINLPTTVTDLTVCHCTGTAATDVMLFLYPLSSQLSSLSLHHLPHADATMGQPGGPSVFDSLLRVLTRLERLSIDIDLISPDFFLRAPKKPHPLEFLELTKSTDSCTADAQIFPLDIHCAISEYGLKNMRRIRTSKSVWLPLCEGQGQELEQLADLLQTLEFRDWDREAGLEVDSESEGDDSDSEEERWRKEAEERWKGRKRKAGLWIFDE